MQKKVDLKELEEMLVEQWKIQSASCDFFIDKANYLHQQLEEESILLSNPMEVTPKIKKIRQDLLKTLKRLKYEEKNAQGLKVQIDSFLINKQYIFYNAYLKMKNGSSPPT